MTHSNAQLSDLQGPAFATPALSTLWQIWSGRAYLNILEAEKKHPRILKAYWRYNPAPAFKEQDIVARAEAAATQGVFRLFEEGSLPHAYFTILLAVFRLDQLSRTPAAIRATRFPPTRENRLDALAELAPSSDSRLLDQAVAEIAKLQHGTEALAKVLQTPDGIPVDPRMQAFRRKRGAEIRHRDQPYLKHAVMDLISTLKTSQKFSSVDRMFSERENLKKFENLLTTFQAGLGKPRVKGAPVSHYASTMTLDGLLRTIKTRWMKDPAFRSHVETICVVRTRSPASTDQTHAEAHRSLGRDS